MGKSGGRAPITAPRPVAPPPAPVAPRDVGKQATVVNPEQRRRSTEDARRRNRVLGSMSFGQRAQTMDLKPQVKELGSGI